MASELQIPDVVVNKTLHVQAIATIWELPTNTRMKQKTT